MVRNTSGGTGHKSQARKFVSNAKSSVLRCPEEQGEQFGYVIKNFGGGVCNVITNINNKPHTMRCHIRGKFRLRNRKHNMVETGSLLLIGLREWEAPNYKECDVLEVYDSDSIQMFTSMPHMMSLIQPLHSSYQGLDASKDTKTSTTTDQIEFTVDASEQTFVNAIETNTGTFYQNEEQVNIDDI